MTRDVYFRLTAGLKVLIAAILLTGCSGSKSTDEKTVSSKAVPVFNVDSAYSFVEKQVSFGPRVPNSRAHQIAGDYLIAKLKGYGALVTVQSFEASTFDGKKVSLRNIIAAFNPALQKRVILAAHWDTRPFADKDPEKPNASIDGANDGASGVAVLLEIARLMNSNNKPEVGIDIILFDGEDWGEKHDESSHHALPQGQGSWWCLGSQYWSTNKHKPAYQAQYGILLDMVGGRNAKFFREGTSLEYAGSVVTKIWTMAAKKGYSSVFVHQDQDAVLDDHQFMNEKANIPTADIISYDPVEQSFGAFHHTTNDNISIISKETLGTVGTVVLAVIYAEQ